MEHNETTTTVYGTRDWIRLLEAGYVTVSVDTDPVHRFKRAYMLRQRNEHGQLTTHTPRQAYLS